MVTQIRTPHLVSGLSMMKSDEDVIYESPDNGKTVYARRRGSSSRHLQVIDNEVLREQKISERWVKFKGIIALAETDDIIDSMLTKLEMIYALKK